MRQSHKPEPAPERRRPRRPSATTAAGIAAERVALAERRMSNVRAAARHLEARPAGR
jgi:hypothetical protein